MIATNWVTTRGDNCSICVTIQNEARWSSLETVWAISRRMLTNIWSDTVPSRTLTIFNPLKLRLTSSVLPHQTPIAMAYHNINSPCGNNTVVASTSNQRTARISRNTKHNKIPWQTWTSLATSHSSMKLPSCSVQSRRTWTTWTCWCKTKYNGRQLSFRNLF